MGRLYDVLSIWRERAVAVTGRSLPTGHNLQEDAPDLVAAEMRAFLKGKPSPNARVRRSRLARPTGIRRRGDHDESARDHR